MKLTRIMLIAAVTIFVGIGYVWWLTIQQSKRIVSPDNWHDVVYSSDSTDQNDETNKDTLSKQKSKILFSFISLLHEEGLLHPAC